MHWAWDYVWSPIVGKIIFRKILFTIFFFGMVNFGFWLELYRAEIWADEAISRTMTTQCNPSFSFYLSILGQAYMIFDKFPTLIASLSHANMHVEMVLVKGSLNTKYDILYKTFYYCCFVLFFSLLVCGKRTTDSYFCALSKRRKSIYSPMCV